MRSPASSTKATGGAGQKRLHEQDLLALLPTTVPARWLIWPAVVLLCGPAMQTALAHLDPSRTSDGALHLFRAIEISRILASGQLFSRWAPDFNLGLGSPLFNFYTPLVYYLTALCQWAGTTPVTAFRLVAAGIILLAAIGACGLGRHLFGIWAGLVSAMCYAYSPYLLFDLFGRGDLAEVLALALLPWAAWALLSLSKHPTPRRCAIAALTSAALLLAHNLIGVLWLVLLAIWGGALLLRAIWAGHNAQTDLQPALATTLLATLLAVGLAAFLYLPAAVERHTVLLANAALSAEHWPWQNFRPWAETFSFPTRFVTSRLNNGYRVSVGTLQYILALLALVPGQVRMIRGRPRVLVDQRIVVLGAASLLLLGLALPWSTALWHWSPLIFVQFPWRLLGPLSLGLALLAGSLATRLSASEIAGRLSAAPISKAALFASAAAGLALLAAFPLLYPHYTPRQVYLPPHPSAAAIPAFELASGSLGTTVNNEFMPVSRAIALTQSPFMAAYARGEIDTGRGDSASLPSGAVVLSHQQRGTNALIRLSSAVSFSGQFLVLAYPGWEVQLDGHIVPWQVSPGTGYIQVPVPTGVHTILLHFVETPLRRAADMLSLLALLLVINGLALPRWPQIPAWLEYSWREAKESAGPPKSSYLADKQSVARSVLTRPLLQSLLLIVLVLPAIGKATLLDSGGPFLRHDSLSHPAGCSHPIQVMLSNRVLLRCILIEEHPATVVAPATLQIQLYWQALQPLSHNYRAFAHLFTASGKSLQVIDKSAPGDLPTSRWQMDGYILDSNLFVQPGPVPSGGYQVELGMWDPDTGQRLAPAAGPTGNPLLNPSGAASLLIDLRTRREGTHNS